MTTGSLLLETRGLSPDSALEIIPAQEEETQEGEGGEATRQKESQEEAGSTAGEWCSRGRGAHPGKHPRQLNLKTWVPFGEIPESLEAMLFGDPASSGGSWSL